MGNLGTLREVREDELELIRTWRNAPAVRANMYTRHEISPDEHLAWWDKVRQSDECKYFMWDCAGVPLGVVAFVAIDRVSKNASWAFYASPDAPKGSGSKMEFLALEHAFGELGLHKLYCEVLAFNVAVVGLHKKYGFASEGVFRQHHLVEGEYVDVVRLGILEHEWRQLRDDMKQRLDAASRA